MKHGTKGSARIDVEDTTTGTAYDYKFVIRPPGLKQSQINKIQRNAPHIQRVLEVNP